MLAVGRGYLFSGSWDKTVRVWSAETLTCVKVRDRAAGELCGKSARAVRALGWAAQGRLALCSAL